MLKILVLVRWNPFILDNKAFSAMAELMSFSPPTEESEPLHKTRPSLGRQELCEEHVLDLVIETQMQ